MTRQGLVTDQGRFAAHADIAQLIVNAWRLRHDDTRQARGMALRALAVAQTRADDRGKAWAALRLAVCNQIMAVEPEAELPRLHECVTAMRALGDGRGEAEALNLLGNALINRARYEEAQQAHGQCQALREGLGDLPGVAGSLGNQAIAQRALGRWAEARASGEGALRLARSAGNVRAIAYGHAGLGLTELLAGDAPSAVRHLELCFAAAVRTEDRALECTALTRLAQARLLLGELDQARELLAHAQAMARRTGNVGDAGRVCMVWGLLARACGRADRAEVHFEAAMHEARRSHDLSLVREVETARTPPGP